MAKMQLVKRNKPKEILTLVQHETRIRMLKAKLDKYHAYDISEAILMMDEVERQRLYENIKIEKIALVFEQLDEEKAALFLQEMPKAEATQILEQMEPDDAIDILQELDIEESTEYLVLMDDEDRERLKRLARYKNSTAGSEMNSMFVAIDPEMDVKQAMKKLVQEADEVEMIDTLFVIDDDQTLIGLVDLRELIVAKSPKKIKSIMDKSFYSVHVDDDIQEVVKDIQRYDTNAMPVLNDFGQIEGIITMYDALDIIEEEAHDDYAKLAAISTDYDMRQSAFINAKRRFLWLALLLVLNILVTGVIASYEGTISRAVALVLFQPLILGMAGNIGTQSLAVTILGISRETLHSKINIIAHLTKEFLVGIINGLILGLLAFGFAYARLTLSPIGVADPKLVAIVVGLSVFSALTISAFIGSAIPLLLNAMKIDPAVASGPFITTINDITALIVYFGLAALIILPLLP
ncbi:MAG: magnesium transporter [Candidatus Izemoplasmataceae bacterium]